MFVPPKHLSATGFADEPGLLRLMTLRSNDQCNTTIYGYEDRLRDVSGTRDLVFMNPADIEQFGLFDGKVIGLATVADDAIIREKHGLKVFAYDVPRGCIGAYYPECNVLIPLSHHAEEKQSSRRQVGAGPHHPITTSMGTEAAGPSSRAYPGDPVNPFPVYSCGRATFRHMPRLRSRGFRSLRCRERR
jgi:anaerobic selenocysteine-containing dehydrogenase